MASILVVEDEPTVRDLIVLNLEAEGHVVTAANDGNDALRLLHERGFDALVLDVMLPGTSGHALLSERLRLGLAPVTRIVMLTALADDRSHLRAFELGCDAYLTKPFSPDELVDVIDQVLAASLPELARHRHRERAKAEALVQLEDLQANARARMS